MKLANVFLPEIRGLMQADPAALREVLDELHPADLADLVESCADEEARSLLTALPADKIADALEYIEEPRRGELLLGLPPSAAAKFVGEMAPDERVDVLEDLPDDARVSMLAQMPREDAAEAQALMAYEPNSAGGLMTPEFVRLRETMTADDAIAHIRRVATERETVYYCYALDADGRLLGIVSLGDLVIAGPTTPVSDIMKTQVVTVDVRVDQEEVARLIARYDLLAIPVVDVTRGEQMVGIITHDDIVDVVAQEATEDMQKMGGTAPIQEPYFGASLWTMIRKRAGWLVVLFLGELVTSNALHHFQTAIEGAVALVFFLPLVISSGGNSGSQSATLVVRALAVGEIVPRQFLRVFGREILMGMALGVVLGGIGFGRALVGDVPVPIAVTVSLTLVAVVLAGAVIGALMPLLLKALRFDPAVSSAPFIASLVDVIGIVVYFNVARLFLAG